MTATMDRTIQLTHAEREARRKEIADLMRAGDTDVPTLAKQFNLGHETIKAACYEHGVRPRWPARSMCIATTPKNIKVPAEVWAMVNWNCQDTIIADVFGISRERVRQVRLRLGKPLAKMHHEAANQRLKFSEWVAQHRGELGGMTIDAVIAKARLSVARRTATAVLDEMKVPYVFCHHRSKMKSPWHLVDWRLPNCVIFRILREETGHPSHCGTVNARRVYYQPGTASLRYGYEFEEACKVMIAKVRHWFSKGRFADMAVPA